MTVTGSASHNTARVLNLLWRKPGISRVEMADELGLNRSTVTLVVNEMIDRRLVKEVALADASRAGGRKKVQLAIDARYGCAGGVQVHADYVRLVLVDLGGRVLHHEVSAGAVTARTLVKRLQKACEALVQRARQLGIRLLGIGCGVPGIVDPQRGVLLQSIPLGVEDEVRLVERLQPALARPVYLDNDAHSCCWGELTAGAAASDSFLFILGEWRRAPQRVGALLTAIAATRPASSAAAPGSRATPASSRSATTRSPRPTTIPSCARGSCASSPATPR